MEENDTISAISTPMGEGGIGIVRMSGPGAIAIAGRLFVSPKGKIPGEKTHCILYGFIEEPEGGERIDEVLITAMKAPNTYTKEDIVEINCHGGMGPIRRVLELTIKEGARLALPGEFTKRAFLNGRIDLSQAEAVSDIIRAKTEVARRLSLEQIEGVLSKKINAMRDKLVHTLAHIEAHLDFPEEEIEPQSLDEMKWGIEALLKETAVMVKSYDEGRFFREGLKVVIAGRPNVGKSSLLNALLERDRAIVTEMPGTTRDVLEEYLNIKGLPVRIMDTAGIREAHNMAEAEGVRRTLNAIEGADLVLGVIDGSRPLTEADAELSNTLREKPALIVINKTDLGAVVDGASGLGGMGSATPVPVSAKTGEGLEALKAAIYESCVGQDREPSEGVIITNLRHKLALQGVADALHSTIKVLDREPLEIVSFELRTALDRLGEITGAVTNDDILDAIFREFCIGK